MNRPIKFRVWDKITNRYLQELGIYYWHIPYSLDGEEITGEANLVGLSELLRHDNFVVQQYTGLKDSKGKEVYEGDVIIDKKYKFFDKKYKEYRQCIWDQERLTYRWVGKNMSLPIYTSDDNMTLKEKIVGNIFEHTYLLR